MREMNIPIYAPPTASCALFSAPKALCVELFALKTASSTLFEASVMNMMHYLQPEL